jgi:5-methylcytosine-specific restriction endonuclease McrA
MYPVWTLGEPRASTSSTRIAAPPSPAHRDTAEPLTAELSRLHVTVSRRFLEKLEAARAALSHARPGANAEEILEAGLDLVLAQQAKRKGLVEKPRKESRPAESDRIPAHVKRQVWTRDGGRCQWPVGSGGICGSTLRVEFDHRVPRAWGGPSTVDNVRLLCRAHNDLAARRAFGDDWMNWFTRKRAEDGPAERAAVPTGP